MKLIENASKWYRMFSVQALMFIGALQSILLVVPADKLAGHVPFTVATTWADLGTAFTIAGAVVGAIGRLIDQGHATDTPPKA